MSLAALASVLPEKLSPIKSLTSTISGKDKKLLAQIEMQILENMDKEDEEKKENNDKPDLYGVDDKKDDKDWYKNQKMIKFEDNENISQSRISNPFLSRDLSAELQEVVFSFDVVKYGRAMTKLVINEIREYSHEELWEVLTIIMEAVPFAMGMEMLKQEINTLKRATNPEYLYNCCKTMVEGTSFTVAANLRMAEFFEQLASEDLLQEDVWNEYRSQFENGAHHTVNDIESDHLLYIMLSVPLSDTKEPISIIQLALEQQRLSFLNNERILSIIRHVWNHGMSISVDEEVDMEDLSLSELIQTLFYQPIKFYMTPIVFNWTVATLYLLYLILA